MNGFLANYGWIIIFWIVASIFFLPGLIIICTGIIKLYKQSKFVYIHKIKVIIDVQNNNLMEEVEELLEHSNHILKNKSGITQKDALLIDSILKETLDQLKDIEIEIKLPWTSFFWDSLELIEELKKYLQKHKTIQKQINLDRVKINELLEAEQYTQDYYTHWEDSFKILEQHIYHFTTEIGSSLSKWSRQQKEIQELLSKSKQWQYSDTIQSFQLLKKVEQKVNILQKQYEQLKIYYQYAIEFEDKIKAVRLEIYNSLEKHSLLTVEIDPYQWINKSINTLEAFHSSIRQADLLQAQSLWNQLEDSIEKSIVIIENRIALQENVREQHRRAHERLQVLKSIELELSVTWVSARQDWKSSVWNHTFKNFEKACRALQTIESDLEHIQQYLHEDIQKYIEAEKHLIPLDSKLIYIEQELYASQEQLQLWQQLQQQLPEKVKQAEYKLKYSYAKAEQEAIKWNMNTMLDEEYQSIQKQHDKVHDLFSESPQNLNPLQQQCTAYIESIEQWVSKINTLIDYRDDAVPLRLRLENDFKLHYRTVKWYLPMGESERYKNSFKKFIKDYEDLTMNGQYESAFASLQNIKGIIAELQLAYDQITAQQQALKKAKTEERYRTRQLQNQKNNTKVVNHYHTHTSKGITLFGSSSSSSKSKSKSNIAYRDDDTWEDDDDE